MERRNVVEITGQNLDPDRIQELASQCGASDTQLYQWQDHIAIYSEFESVEEFVKQLDSNFPDLEIKLYDHPFYEFKNGQHCENCTVANEWQHILLTANLVDDKAMQSEYLEYHRTQFQEWPEVAQGFCNAGFQELNVYLNGRQLMLIISIPADKTLAELDPKTLENNPRGDEWNKIMSRFQEGIKGTKPGECWVFLDKLK